jgi:hypothetical protein
MEYKLNAQDSHKRVELYTSMLRFGTHEVVWRNEIAKGDEAAGPDWVTIALTEAQEQQPASRCRSFVDRRREA